MLLLSGVIVGHCLWGMNTQMLLNIVMHLYPIKGNIFYSKLFNC
jgi:hypothetical protein